MDQRLTTTARPRHVTPGAWQLALLAVLLLAPMALAAGPARLMVLQDDELGKYLTDDLGRGLYVFVDPSLEDDLGTAGSRPTPTCDATCRAVWRPVITDGAPDAVPAIQAGLIGTTDTDAGAQVTFDGWPLYRYAADRTRGDRKGEGIEPPVALAFGGAWYLIAPDGNLVKAEEDSTPATTPASGGGSSGGSGGSSGGSGRPAYY